MKESRRNTFFGLFLFLLLSILGLLIFLKGFGYEEFYFTEESSVRIFSIGVTVVFLIMFGLMVNELLYWRKIGKRSGAFDLILLVYIFITVYIVTYEPNNESAVAPVMNSIIGAFGIFIIFGAYELREYEVLNKLLIITAVTYNVIFIATLVNSFLRDVLTSAGIKEWIIRDTAFSFSIWIILILGFALFGRKYIVVLRFMSPEYLTMFLYIIAWLAVRTVSLIWSNSIDPEVQRHIVYASLMVISWVVYAISGPVLDMMLGIKRVSKQIEKIDAQLETETDKDIIKALEKEKKQYIQLQKLVDEVSAKVNLKRPVKVGFAKYPILNAMAYGAFFDKRIAIISSDINEIPEDELKGIISHELHHAKGLDTLILSIISSVQLGIFWAIKNWPATMYDYSFGEFEPVVPIWAFIVVNFGITLIIYVFIRMLEGRADRRTRESGYGNELAKGLYNLEGFYSSGREIGLDTMLLSEEQILEYNKVDNYSITAQYLDRHMDNPKPINLLSNLMNSHPPSYLRILAMYDEEDQIKPARGSILPFILVGKQQRLKYSINMKKAREKYREMANTKFKSMFGIENYAAYLNMQKKKEVYEIMMGKMYLHADTRDFTVGIGVLKNLQINDEVCEPFRYEFSSVNVKSPKKGQKNVDSEEIIRYNTSHVSEETYTIPEDVLNLKQIEFGALHQFSKNRNAVLVAVSVDPILHEKAAALPRDVKSIGKSYKLFKKYLKKYISYVFVDEKGRLIYKKWRFKLKFNLNSVHKAKGKKIFLQESGTLHLLVLKDIHYNETGFDFKMDCVNTETGETTTYALKDILLKKDEFGLHFHNSSEDFADEIKILRHIKEKNTRTTIYLKKAVNNVETGYITSITIDSEDIKEKSYITIQNVNQLSIDIPLKKIETMVFSENTIRILNKSKMSIGERILNKILYWTHPDQVYMS